MPSHSTYCLNGVSLTLGVRYLLSAAPPNLGHGVAPLGHSCAVAAAVLLWCRSLIYVLG